jgi:hypothetical protein
MACGRFTEALRARALGAPLRADAAAHLAVCPHCQAMLESEERLLATIGQALHDVGTVTPAPEFLSRVRAHVERAPRWNPGALLKPAVIVAAAVLVAIIGGRARQDHAPVRRPAIAAAPQRAGEAGVDKAADGRLTLGPSAPASARRTRAERPRAARADRASLSPEVLVPPDQRRVVNRLFDSLRAGRPDVVSALMSLHAGGSVTEPEGLTIAPIQIEPVVVSALPLSAPIMDK